MKLFSLPENIEKSGITFLGAGMLYGALGKIFGLPS